MRLLTRTSLAIALAAALGGCSLGGLLGGGGKPPPTLLTLTPEAADPGAIARTAAAGQAVTIATPVVAQGAAHGPRAGPGDADRHPICRPTCSWVDTPDQLFQSLLAETVRRTTNRVVLDPGQSDARSGPGGQRRAAALRL